MTRSKQEHVYTGVFGLNFIPQDLYHILQTFQIGFVDRYGECFTFPVCAISSEKRMVKEEEEEKDDEGTRLIECLRGRLLAERQASRAAKEEAELVGKRVTNPPIIFLGDSSALSLQSQASAFIFSCFSFVCHRVFCDEGVGAVGRAGEETQRGH